MLQVKLVLAFKTPLPLLFALMDLTKCILASLLKLMDNSYS